MLSQDNSSSAPPRSKTFQRTIISTVSSIVLASLGVLATTTQLQWQLPSIGGNDAAPITIAALSVKKVVPSPAPRIPSYKDAKEEEVAKEMDFIAVKTVGSPTLQSRAMPRHSIRQPGDNIIIKQLSYAHNVPVNSSGMPEFYKFVLEPKGQLTENGLMQRKAKSNFGYDQQDIFTGEVPDGAYVLHCQRNGTTTIRAMCWRELQVSNDQWVQYRFPRTQLKDWWKIEQKVRANIG